MTSFYATLFLFRWQISSGYYYEIFIITFFFFAFHYFYGIKEKRSIGTGKYTNNTSVANKKYEPASATVIYHFKCKLNGLEFFDNVKRVLLPSLQGLHILFLIVVDCSARSICIYLSIHG